MKRNTNHSFYYSIMHGVALILLIVLFCTAAPIAHAQTLATGCGAYHTAVTTVDGAVYTWGDNGDGELGNNSTIQSTVPVAVTTSGVLSGKTITAVAVGGFYTVALASDGTVYTWGNNASGQLGNNGTTGSNVPVAVTISGVLSDKTITAVAAGYTHTVALASNGTMYSWGYNVVGQLGNSSTTQSTVPVAVSINSLLLIPIITSVKDVPNDQGGNVEVLWKPSFYDVSPKQSITSYTIYRGVVQSALKKTTSTPKIGRTIQLSVNGLDIYWEEFKTVSAKYLSGYSCEVATLSDSVSPQNPKCYFMVIANTSNQYVFYTSPIDSAYSVDNLSPAAVTKTVSNALPTGAIQLRWNANFTDPDLAGYRIYRSDSSGFAVNISHQLAATKDTIYTDSLLVVGKKYYYRITAIDVHGNQSAPSAEISQSSVITGIVQNAPIMFALHQNYPNPFNPSTTIQYDISEHTRVSLAVYDIMGREVAMLVNEYKTPGHYQAVFHSSQLSSGVYFYKLQAGNFTSVRKLLLMK